MLALTVDAYISETLLNIGIPVIKDTNNLEDREIFGVNIQATSLILEILLTIVQLNYFNIFFYY